MPKDATKNVDRYKVRGGQLNEFELTENRKALAEKKPKGDAKLIPGTPPEEASEGLQTREKSGRSTKSIKGSRSTKRTRPSEFTKSTKQSNATRSTKAKATKSTKSAQVNSSRGATAKKLAARKAARKK